MTQVASDPYMTVHIVVLLALAAVTVLLRRGRQQRVAEGEIRILERRALAPRVEIIRLSVGKERLIVALCEKQVSVLTREEEQVTP
jgi:flagellar biogenesis protein FliO